MNIIAITHNAKMNRAEQLVVSDNAEFEVQTFSNEEGEQRLRVSAVGSSPEDTLVQSRMFFTREEAAELVAMLAKELASQ